MEGRGNQKRKAQGKERLKHLAKSLTQYLPWLLLLLGMDGFAALLLWLADLDAFWALWGVVCLGSVIFFTAVFAALLFQERGREKAFLSFLETPDEYHEELLLDAVCAAWAPSVRLLGAALRERQSAYCRLQDQVVDYEEYVEAWVHEAKMPLSLLTLLLDNRREELPGPVAFKLDYIRNRLQEYVDQMLFYARLKGARKDYLFEYVNIGECIQEVLEDYYPLLEEKKFRVTPLEAPETELVYTDRRGLRFLLQQAVSNAVKYCKEEPQLSFALVKKEKGRVLEIRDNGTGVPACDLPYIFEKGFTGESGQDRKKATGMGLYLAREIARDLGLALEAESRPGEGFQIAVAFPVIEEPFLGDSGNV